MDQSKRPGSITFLLVGLVLLVTMAGLYVGLVPTVDCPVNQWDSFVDGMLRSHAVSTVTPLDCWRCHGHGRITLLNKWLYGDLIKR